MWYIYFFFDELEIVRAVLGEGIDGYGLRLVRVMRSWRAHEGVIARRICARKLRGNFDDVRKRSGKPNWWSSEGGASAGGVKLGKGGKRSGEWNNLHRTIGRAGKVKQALRCYRLTENETWKGCCRRCTEDVAQKTRNKNDSTISTTTNHFAL